MKARKLTPAILAVPGLLIVAYACEMTQTTGSDATGTGFSHSETSQAEHRGTHAVFFNTTPQTIGSAWDSSKVCGGSQEILNDLEDPVSTTSMTRGLTELIIAYANIHSHVYGTGGHSDSYWRDPNA